MIDVRHLSNQRFMANPKGVAVDRTPKYQPRQKIKKIDLDENEEDEEENDIEIAENKNNIEKKLKKEEFNLKSPDVNSPVRQTGINILQPKDVRKVFDTKIQTPEFDSLSTSHKNDVNKRIFIDE